MPTSKIVQISIIIVNYNTSEYLIKCLESIYDMTSGVEIEVIVIDNNSIDRSIENLKEIFPEVKLILRSVNGGFGSGCNEGAKYAKGNYLAFVNPDIILRENVFCDFFDFMENNSEVGMCSGSFYDFDGIKLPTYCKFPGTYSELLEIIGRGTQRRLMKFLDSKEMKSLIPFKVDWITGACMFFRKEHFNQVGGFDENFFLYYEDVDIQYRLKKAGYSVVCIPILKIYHFNNSSINGIEGEYVYNYNMHRSNLLYMYKHFLFFKRNFVRLLFIFAIFVRFGILFFRKSFKNKINQKLMHYKEMLILYCSSYSKLISNNKKQLSKN